MRAISNIRQLGLALFMFDTEYGTYPNADTSRLLQESSKTRASLDPSTSNGIFRQLIVSGILSDEHYFINGTSSKKPDNIILPGKMLEKGECDIAYFPPPASGGSASRPILIFPVIPGTRRFNPKPFAGKAYILFTDNTVIPFPIDPSGRVLLDGRDLLDPGHPVWNGTPPVILWPE